MRDYPANDQDGGCFNGSSNDVVPAEQQPLALCRHAAAATELVEQERKRITGAL